MLAHCKAAAEREGLSSRLYQQALHNLDLPRHYQTIVACGVFGIGVSREQDYIALERFYQHLLPGGMLLLEVNLHYEDSKVWQTWRKDERKELPESWSDDIGKIPEDGRAYELHYRLVAVDPLEQRSTGEMRMLLFKDNEVVSDDMRMLTSNYYFRNKMHLSPSNFYSKKTGETSKLSA
jgi:hypothetical protein